MMCGMLLPMYMISHTNSISINAFHRQYMCQAQISCVNSFAKLIYCVGAAADVALHFFDDWPAFCSYSASRYYFENNLNIQMKILVHVYIIIKLIRIASCVHTSLPVTASFRYTEYSACTHASFFVCKWRCLA